MTVKQETRTLPVVALPQPRAAADDAVTPAAPPLRGWGSHQDRTIMRWMLAGMVALALFAALMVYLGTRVIG